MDICHLPRLVARFALLAALATSPIFTVAPTLRGAERGTGQSGTAKIGPSKGPGAAWYAPGPLQIKIGGGDVTSWKTTTVLTQPTKTQFRWQPLTADPLKALWQLSSVAFPPDQSGARARGLIASGAIDVPASGKWGHFEIDFTQHLPAQPPAEPRTYYVRVMALVDRQPFKALTENVEITHKKYEPSITIHSPTVKETHKSLYSSSPMTVEIDLNELYIGNENEGGDEPYLLLAIVYADGTTINPLDFKGSSVRIRTPSKVHGNVFDDATKGGDLNTGKTAKIPNGTGRFVESIAPIGLDLAADLEESAFPTLGEAMSKHTKIYILAVAMEEDATSDAAANAARNAAIDALRSKVNAIVQGMTLQDLQKGKVGKFNPAEIQQEIQSKAIGAATDATLSGPWFMAPVFPTLLGQAADPDDYVGWGLKAFSYQEILQAGSNGINFEMQMANSKDWQGSYTLRGKIRRQ